MKYIRDFIIINKENLNSEYYTLELFSKEKLPLVLPGQFVEILINNSNSVFLRRPFSVHFVDYNKNTIKLLIQIVGKASFELSKIRVNEKLNLIFPLGNSYSIVSEKKILLIGGGCGIAPLLYLAKLLSEKNNKITTLIGVRNKEKIIELNEYSKYSEVLITTEDGSFGEKGYVTNSKIFDSLTYFDKIYTCGPEIMMKAISKRAKQNKINCEVSLENSMACGIGACLCCVTETVNGNKCVCSEGPVFNTELLKW